MKRLFILSLILLVAVGCSKKDKQEIAGATNSVQNAVKSATGDNGKEMVASFLQALQSGDPKAVVKGKNINAIKNTCEDNSKNEPDYKRNKMINECIEKSSTDDNGQIAFYTQLKILPKSARFEIIESKDYVHYVKVTYSNKNEAFEHENKGVKVYVKECVFPVIYDKAQGSLNFNYSSDSPIRSRSIDVLSAFD